MASSTPTQYTITPSKPHQNHPPNPHKTSHILLTSSTPTTTTCCTTTTTTTLNPSCRPFYPSRHSQPQPELGPEFRKTRTTRLVSKRNLTSPKPPNPHTRTASRAALNCTAQILAGPDDQFLARILSGFAPALTVPEDYCFILHELGDRDKRPPTALGFFNSAMPLMRNPTQQGKLLTAAIGSLGKMGRHDLAKKLFDSGVRAGYGNTVFAHSALISAYAKSGLSAEAIGVFDSMKALGLRPNIVSYNAVINACGKGGVDLRFTAGLFREMLGSGLRPDRKTFNSLLAACSRAGNLDEAHTMFDEMVRLGVGRDIYTYNTFIDAICKCGGDMELAVRVMSDMPAIKLRPNVITYSTLIDGYSKLERFDEALGLYEEMRSKGIRLDRVCYNTLLSIYVKTERYAEIANICEEMDATGVDKDTVTYNSLIHGYGKLGRFGVVSFLIQDMRERGIAPSVLTYSTLIDVYSKAGMYGDAANVFLEFRESGLKADVVLYSSFIDTLAKNGLVECAVWLLDEMARIGVDPNVVTFNAVIDGFGKSRFFFEDGVAGESEGTEGCSHQIVRAFDQLARGLGRPLAEEATRRSGELFCILGLFQKMIQQGVRPNVVTFSAILNACSRCDSFKDASLLLEQLRLFDNFAYGVAHGLLIGYRDAWVQALTLFDDLRRMDTPTSSAFYNALTDMLWHFGQKRGAQQVVLEGVHRQVWENTWSEFSLDLHLMSTGAAQAMVHTWLLSIHSFVFQGRKLPESLSILTGWGKHSKVVGASTLRRVIESLLDSIGAPFHVKSFNIGRFVSSGAVVAAWLRESRTITILMLHDQRIQTESPAKLLHGLHALQL